MAFLPLTQALQQYSPHHRAVRQPLAPNLELVEAPQTAARYKKKGYSVDRIINYTSESINQIEQNTLDYIKKNTPDVIFVYSEKSAINLKDLIKKYSLVDVMVLSNLMCISKKTSKVLEFIKWKKVIFFNPGEEEFFLNKIN